MSHFAKVINGIVTEVIVADQDFINSGAVGLASEWIQTSYNTRGGKHYDPTTGKENTSAQNPALRANYAGIGYIYDAKNDVFYAPQPYPSWTISAPNWTWMPPVPFATDGKTYLWNETAKSWDVVNAN